MRAHPEDITKNKGRRLFVVQPMKGNVLFICVAAIFGIVLSYFPLQPFLLLLTFLFFLFVLFRKQKLFPYCLVAMVVFYVYFLHTDSQNSTKLSQDITQFSIRFVSSVVVEGDQLTALVTTEYGEKVKLTYRIKSKEEKSRLASLSIGAVCSFQGKLEAPRSAQNPNAFDYQKYLYFQRIHWLLKPDSFPVEGCHKTSPTLYERLLLIRERGITYIGKHFPPSSAGIVQALVYGEREYMNEDVLEGYQKLGLVHLLAISGLHVAILVGLGFYLAIRFGFTRESTTLILLFLLPVYMVLTGGSPSVVRASLMVMIMMISLRWRTTIHPIDSISITCLVMLMYDPYAIFHPGFQLSFVVSLALLLSASIAAKYKNFIRQLAIATCIAQLSSLPILLYHFFEFSLFSLPLNMLFIPLYTFIVLPLSLLVLAVHYFFQPLGELLIPLLDTILVIANELVKAIVTYVPVTMIFGRPNPVLLLLYCSVIVLAFINLERNEGRKRNLQAVAYLSAVLLIDWISPYLDRHGEVVMLDVDQGDCIYIELPYRKGVYLIDTGGFATFSKEPWQRRKNEFDIGQHIVVPFLKSKGVTKIDKLIITHGDYDHLGGAMAVLNEIKVKQLFIGQGEEKASLEERLVAAAKRKGIVVKSVGRGDYWTVGDTTFYILAPGKKVEGKNKNDRSIVLYAQLGAYWWLFTGDLEEEGERELIRAFPQVRAEVLKIGHHGSLTSTSIQFLETVRPKIALISVGERNRYGHPDKRVVQRLKERNIQIFRTDINGAISYRYTKNSGTFTTTLP